VKVLKALANASVVTDPTDVQIVNVSPPSDLTKLVDSLGQKTNSTSYTKDTLSSGVVLISKPSNLNAPPWQMVSAVLGVFLCKRRLGGPSLKSTARPQQPRLRAGMTVSVNLAPLKLPRRASGTVRYSASKEDSVETSITPKSAFPPQSLAEKGVSDSSPL